MNFLQTILRLAKAPYQKIGDRRHLEPDQAALKKIKSLNSEELTTLRSQCLNLSKEQLIEMLLEVCRTNHELEYMRLDREDDFIQLFQDLRRTADNAADILRGDLQRSCRVTPGIEGVISNIINLLAKDLDEAVSQLSPDHHLFKKYKLNKSIFVVDGIEFEFVYVPEGEFLMGSSLHQSEAPIHEVTLVGFWLGKYPITQRQYLALMGENPSYFKGEYLPVDSVSWYDAQKFCQALSTKIGKNLSLPSEAQWEYAARKEGYGSYSNFSYSGSDILEEVAWFKENSDNTTHSVYSKNCNGVGAYGMSGNIWEWCQDSWHPNYNGAPSDGTMIWSSDEIVEKVLRGGCWNSDAKGCLTSTRHRHNAHNRFSNCGFRIVFSH